MGIGLILMGFMSYLWRGFCFGQGFLPVMELFLQFELLEMDSVLIDFMLKLLLVIQLCPFIVKHC